MTDVPVLKKEDLQAPKLARVGKGLVDLFKQYPVAILITGIILLGLIYLYPIQTTTFVITVGVSVFMAWIMFRILNSKSLSQIRFTATERALISGGVAGITGYLVGSWTRDNIIPYLKWSPLIQQVD